MILRCPCSAPATHQLTIQLVPLGSDPAVPPETHQGYFSAKHLPTLTKAQRDYARIGLAVIDYEISELIGT